jgi:ribulose bisphosphate carboxylase small subunit
MMQSGHNYAPVVTLQNLDELERHIENTLSDRWIIRIEHSGNVNPVRTQWQQWGKALYCVRDARPVIESIQACVERYPMHSVRLFAEKTSPRTQFVYPVYRPEEGTGSAQVLPGKWESKASSPGDRLNSVDTGAIAARNRVWRRITVTGMLLGSLLLFEEVMAL